MPLLDQEEIRYTHKDSGTGQKSMSDMSGGGSSLASEMSWGAVVLCALAWGSVSGYRSDHGGQEPLGQIPMEDVDMGQRPMGQIPMEDADMGQRPMGQIPMEDADMGQRPMGQIPMEDVDMGQRPMGQIPMGDAHMGQVPLEHPDAEVLNGHHQTFEMGQVPEQVPMGQAPMEVPHSSHTAEDFWGQVPMGQEPMGQEPMGQEPETGEHSAHNGEELMLGDGHNTYGGYSRKSYGGYDGTKSYHGGHYIVKEGPSRKGYSKSSWQSGSYGSGPRPLKYTGYGYHLAKVPCTETLMAPMNSQLRCTDPNLCTATCFQDYSFPTRESVITIVCQDGRWVLQGWNTPDIPACSPVCLPGCENEGVCISPNRCSCIGNFYGPYCQYEWKPCLEYPALSRNSKRSCSEKECKIQCKDGYVFPDGSTATELHCKDGVWEPLRRDWVNVPDCQPVCTPPCQNGGVCLGSDSCQCPQEFRGAQCQYSASSCDVRALGFNGNYKCTTNSNMETLECSLRCPDGMKFAQDSGILDPTALSSTHVCTYATGQFTPAIAPRCVFDKSEDMLLSYLFPEGSNYSSHVSYHDRHHYYGQGGVGVSGGGGGGGGGGGSGQLVETTYNFLAYEVETEWICYTWNAAHYRTFNGRIRSMRTEGDCTNTMIEGTVHHKPLKIMAPVGKTCEAGRCSYFIVQIGETRYNFSSDPTSKLKIHDGQKWYSAPQKFAFEKVEMGPKSMTFTTENKLKITWDLEDTLSIKLDKAMLGSAFGICGTVEGSVYDKTADLYQNFGDSCAVKNDELCLNGETERRAEAFCEKILSESSLADCKKVINPGEFMETCKWDFCACEIGGLKDHDCGCKSFEMYVKECRDHGIEVSNWRSPGLCAMRCDEGKVYQECGWDNTCGRGTGEEKRSCEEGCYCPEGTYLYNGTCLTKDRCPCTLRGKPFPPGQRVPKDCNTCTCTEGHWVCTKLECSARCEAVGDPHYITFDKKSFEFMGKCSYVLVETDNYTVEAENMPCDGSISESMGLMQRSTSEPPTCTKSVTIKIGETVVKLKQGKQVSVNGMDHTLPITLPSAHVRRASSIFLQVDLFDGLDVMWDGSTRVYVHAPPSLKEKTKGLCGTFNGHQSDDFLTPENDIEQDPTVFGNKWKTKDSCLQTNQTKRGLEDCPAELRRQAEEICNKLIQLELFKDCELGDKVEVYRDFCLYDVCSCSHKLSDCYCPIFSSFADRCSKAGFPVDWRSHIRECGIRCPRGQVYEVCGSTCSRSCVDISRERRCADSCVEGCYCPPGQAMDHHEKCIPISDCPCVKRGLDYPAGHREIRRDAKGPQLCTCSNAIWECHSASVHEIALYSNSTDEEKVCSAVRNQVYTHCEPSVPVTCQNMHKKRWEQSERVCYGGCVCKRGYVLDSGTGECVKPDDCPCHHGGRSYSDGQVIQELCNTCECKSGKWNCTDHVCPGSCATWGDSHFRTFDGKFFDFQGSCEYVLAKGALTPAPTDCFSVIVELVPCGSSGVSCAKSVSLHVGQGDLKESLVLDDQKKFSLPQLSRIARREKELFTFVEVPDLGIALQWDRGTRIAVRLDPKWRGKVKGLCGNYNNDFTDDFTSPSGGLETTLEFFGDSWKIHDHCPRAPQIKETCDLNPRRKEWSVEKCSVLKSDIFADCHSEVQVDPYMGRCVFDTCACDEGGDCECLCTAIAAYAQECNAHGVPIKWRSQHLCPLQCDEKCSEYSPCVSTCSLETCDNLLTYQASSVLCKQETCVEGCQYKKCPEGQIYRNTTSLDCVPIAECRPLCLTINGTDYFEGDLVASDACHRCYCSRHRVTCSGQPCAPSTAPPLMEQSITCVTGWSEWINANQHNPNSVENEVEHLPYIRDFRQTGGDVLAGQCTVDKMVDIRCRTVESHLTNKETGEEAECSLERGLFCAGSCSDYEIQILCQCEPIVSTISTTTVTTTSTTTPSTTTQPQPVKVLLCDVFGPLRPHLTDCSKYYQCMETVEGTQLVERQCGGTTLFNSYTLFCDDAKIVTGNRPECKGKLQFEEGENFGLWWEFNITNVHQRPVNLSDGSLVRTKIPVTGSNQIQEERVGEFEHGQKEVIEGCGDGEVWDECAYDCEALCHHAKQTIFQLKCTFGVKCIAGCRPRMRCPAGKRWRDYKTCVSIEDCTCESNGVILKPGEVITPDCRVCQCLKNELVCDESHCITTDEPTTSPQTTTVRTVSPDIIIVHSSVTPPSQCSSDRFIPLLPELPDSAFTASSSKTGHLPINARMISGSGWRPISSEMADQWLQVDLGEPKVVFGISIKGDATQSAKVKTFELLYSSNGVSYSYVGTDSMPEVFLGPVNTDISATRMFSYPIEARFIRILPLTWLLYPALRIELLGCDYSTPPTTTTTEEPTTITTQPTTTITVPTTLAKEVCTDKMSNYMNDEQIKASSSSKSLTQNLVSVYGNGGWMPLTMDKNQWLQFDFLGPRTLTGIMFVGSGSSEEYGQPSWVKTFTVTYSHNGKEWNPVVDKRGKIQKFKGNKDSSTINTIMFWEPINAAFIRITPLVWHNKIVMRAQILGCYEPYPTLPPPTTTEPPRTTVGVCNTCPGATLVDWICPCRPSEWWAGDHCTSRNKCPCFVGFISYAIGTVFDNEDCEQCTCTLNGVANCEPKKCPPCDQGLKRVTTGLCQCVCEPCPAGERLCPTSNICIKESAWCDGIMDCPDDELNCPTTEPPTTTTTTTTTTAAPTTLTVVKVLEVECPPVKCPPGYTVNMTTPVEAATTEEPPAWSPFGKKSKWGNAFRAKGGYGGYNAKGQYKGRGGQKGYGKGWSKTQAPVTTTPRPRHVCPQYECLAVEEQIVETCQRPSCQEGYELSIIETKEGKCPQYSCSIRKVELPNSECNVTGRTFSTFDGTEYKYDICDHLLAQKDDSSWSVKKLKKCNGLPGGPCLLITHNGDKFMFTKDLDSWLNDYHYTIPQLQKIGAQRLEFSVRQVSGSYIIFTSILDFSVIWDSSGNVKIIVPGVARGHVDGLCGYFDGNAENDKRKPNGDLAVSSVEFGDSWGNNTDCETLACPLHVQKAAFEICQTFKEAPLSQCNGVISLDKLISQCVEAICSCVEGGNSTEECRCQAILEGATECQSLLPDADLAMWRVNSDCPVSCPPGLVYKTCFTKVCEPCCAELMLEDACPTTDRCFPGCYCPDGLVRSYDKCVRPADCRDCQCDGIGSARYVTFDRADYTFNSKCTHVLAQAIENAGVPQFKAWTTHRACPMNQQETCLHAITLLFKNHTVQIINDGNVKPSVYVDGKKVKTSDSFDWLTVTESEGKSSTISLPPIYLDLEVLNNGNGFSLKLPSHLYRGKTEGLCGSCNTNTTDDFKTKQGTYTENLLEFGDSWIVKGHAEIVGEEDHCSPVKETTCQPPLEGQPDPCKALLSDTFSKCHLILDPTPYVESCHQGLCANASLCASLEAYARECQNEGICLKWRGSVCPYNCPPGLEYSPCGLGCTETCDNYELLRSSPEKCTASPGDTCNCPKGKVLRDGVCVEERLCKPCDAEGHYAGDIWKPDGCTECSCEKSSIQCRRITCPEVATVCNRGFRSITIRSNESECCPKHMCVPEPTAGTVCPEPVQPQCGFGQILKLESSSAGCQEFICQCMPKEDCSDVSKEMNQLRPAGMVAQLDDSGCCPQVSVECKPNTCPQPPDCPQHHIPVKRDTEGCCPTYRCAIPEGKCLYEMAFIANANGGERERSLLERESVLKSMGETWSDGPCRECECEQETSAKCTLTTCQTPPESDNYVYTPGYVNQKCCPIYRRTACKVGTAVYEVGQVWPTSNPCINASCILGDNGEITKLELAETCKKDCQEGWLYQEAQGDSCCGECKAVGCVVGGKLHKAGAVWLSADNCTAFECIIENNQPQVISSQEKCPDLSDCPKDRIYEDRCCKKCNYTVAENHSACTTESLALNKTIGLIKVRIEGHGECINQDGIQGFAECFGTCDSYTQYNTLSGKHDSNCLCCKPKDFDQLLVPLACEDNFFAERYVAIPKTCTCIRCDEETKGL